MPRLKNIKHEKFAQRFIKQNKTQKAAYLETYPESSPASAEAHAPRIMKRPEVRQRCIEILENTHGLKLQTQLNQLSELSRADKQIALDEILHTVSDNPTRLAATSLILKLHGVVGNGVEGTQIDARSVIFNIGSPDVNVLSNVLDRLEALEQRRDSISGTIVNQEVKQG